MGVPSSTGTAQPRQYTSAWDEHLDAPRRQRADDARRRGRYEKPANGGYDSTGLFLLNLESDTRRLASRQTSAPPG